MKRWFDRGFVFGLPVTDAPALLDRLSLTPQRVEALLGQVPAHVRVHRPEGRWSIPEHAGHLFDHEALLDLRLDDFDRGEPVLHAADLANRRTHEARHNERAPADLVATFRTARMAIHARLAKTSHRDLARLARHPRLDQQMSLAAPCYFMDDYVLHLEHHLRQIGELG